MKYLVLIISTIAVLSVVWAYLLSNRLDVAKNKLTASQAEITALKTEVENYNEKSLQASRQIGELRKIIAKNKDNSDDGYRCLGVSIPSDILDLLRK